MPLTGMERIRSVLRGEEVDRVPYSFWTHLPEVDLNPEKLAEETFNFYRAYNLDFIKNMPNGLFFVEDFGCECDYSKIALGGVAEIKKYGVQTPRDWRTLPEPNVEAGALGRELRSLELLLEMVNGEAPVTATIFSPLTTAYKLCGPRMLQHMRHHPEELKAGLATIARITEQFAMKALQKGCAGVFFASQLATREMLTEEEYAEFGIPYDVQVLHSIRNASWFNVMHIHGTNIMYHSLMDYPVQAFSWHIWETEPSISEFLQRVPDKVIVGGLQRAHITDGCTDSIHKDIEEVMEATGGGRLILAPGCVIRYPVNANVLHNLRNKIEGASHDDLVAYNRFNKFVYNNTNIIRYKKGENMSKMTTNWSLETKMIHAAQFPDAESGAISQRVVPAVAYAFPDAETAAAVVSGEKQGDYYGRYGNPTTRVLEQKIAELEGGEDALGVSSGMAAISTALLAFLEHGDHVLVTKDVYGGTYSFLTSLAPRFGISFEFVDCTSVENVERAIKPNTKALYIETPSNPLLTVLDIRKLGNLCERFDIPMIVDNTFMTPCLQRPLELGADVVVHSATKYINGHGDVLAGLIVGKKRHIEFMRKKIMGDLGQNLNSWEAFLILRGLKTMNLRVEKHCSNAQKIAEFLEGHPAIDKVHYPGLPSHPQHQLAKAQMNGTGGIISFEVKGGLSAGKRFINSLKLAMISFSLGDPETLVQHPASMTHSSIPTEERTKFGISDGLIRLSVGLENAEDIINDLDQSLSVISLTEVKNG